MVRLSEAIANHLVKLLVKEIDSTSPNYRKIYMMARLLARIIAPDDNKLTHLINEIERKWSNYAEPEELIIDFTGLVLHKFEQSLYQSIPTLEEHGEKEKSTD